MVAIRSGWLEPWELLLEPRRPPIDSAALQAGLLGLAEEDGGSLYAVLDAARSDEILTLLVEGQTQHESLYRGTEQEQYLASGPILAHPEQGGALLERLTSSGWGRSWGIWLTSAAPYERLLEHLRTLVFALVPTEQGKERLLFRFYDPRTLRPFLPGATAAELDSLFGPIRRVLVESEDADAILVFDRAERPAELVASDRRGADDDGRAAAPEARDEGFVIRSEQAAALQRALQAQFENRAIRRLRKRLPKRTAALSPDELRARVRAAIGRARHYDIHVGAHVLRYLEHALRHGEAFDGPEGWARPILTDRYLPGILKMDRVAERARAARGQIA